MSLTTVDGEKIITEWSTAEEKEFLRRLAAGESFCRQTQLEGLKRPEVAPLQKLRNYLDWAECHRTDWAGLDVAEVMGYAAKLYWQLKVKAGEVTQQLIRVELPDENNNEANA